MSVATAIATALSAQALGGLLAGLAIAVPAVLGVLALRRRQRRAGRRRSAARAVEPQTLVIPGLLPRAAFDQALDEATQRCDRERRELCLLFVNVDNFRTINDSHGYADGDRVIAQIAERLLEHAGAGAQAARMGGDEFLLLHEGALESAQLLATALVAELGRPYAMPGRDELALAVSIGIAAYPQHASRTQLVAHASAAMRCVKLAGGGSFTVFDPRMAVQMREQAELLNDLRQALSLRQFELFYQPKIDARSLQITAAEALLRWHHPRRGMVSPAVFIPIAERHGLIGAIGDWVIQDACRQAAKWRKLGLRMRVAINISAYQMREDDLVDRLEATLRRNGLQANRFTCEITESVAMEDTQVTQRSFERMRRAGLHVSIDDFGVGQASLSYLRRLPAAELKIDASFVHDIDTSADARSIVDAVVRLAHALQLRVVAEGVETERQRDLLVQMGCDELQGFLFARPMSASALTIWAVDDRPSTGSDFRPSLFQETVVR